MKSELAITDIILVCLPSLGVTGYVGLVEYFAIISVPQKEVSLNVG